MTDQLVDAGELAAEFLVEEEFDLHHLGGDTVGDLVHGRGGRLRARTRGTWIGHKRWAL